jgi:peptidoglycan/LPS O-acetylase OafA/YrhL
MASEQRAARVPHIPALDGMRGIAVLGILLFHAGCLRGGWLGVDLFFVLSGLLITSLLLLEQERTGSISLAAFWGRRARRLLPALIATLFGVGLYAAVLADPSEFSRIRADSIATLFYVANWHSIFVGHEYWDLFRTPSPLDHAWSLAIEEQLYLFWPPILLVVLRRRVSDRGLAAGALSAGFLSAAWMAWLFDPSEGTARVYFGTDTRVAALLVGICAAALSCEPLRVYRARSLPFDLLGWCGVGALAIAWVTLGGDDPRVYRGGLFVLAWAAAAVVAAPIWSREGSVARVFGFAPFRWLGTVSYGAYLWHWPIYLALSPERVGLDGGLLALLRIATALAVAVVSYFALERPVRRGALQAYRPALLTATASALALLCVGLATQGEDAAHSRGMAGNARQRLLLVGDSLAESLGNALRSEAQRQGSFAKVMARHGCGVLPTSQMRFPSGQVVELPHCPILRKEWATYAKQARPDIVFLVEGWAGVGAKRVGARWLRPCEAESDRAYAAHLEGLIGELGASGSRVALMASMSPSLADLSSKIARMWGTASGPEVQRRMDARAACLNDVRRAVAERTGSLLLDLDRALCREGGCPRQQGGVVLRTDGVHFRGEGARWLARWLLGEVGVAVQEPDPKAVPRPQPPAERG